MKNRNRKSLRATLIVASSLLYALAAAYCHIVLHANSIYTHFVYLPIVLAGIWWGRKAILLALAFSVYGFLLHFAFPYGTWLAAEIVRTVFLITVSFFTGALRDRLRFSEKALRGSEESYKQLIDKSIAGIFVYKDDGVLFLNRRMTEILGYSADEVIGRPIWDFIYQPDLPKVRSLVEKRKSGALTDLSYECRLVRRDKSLIWADMASSPMMYDGREAVIVTLYDITKIKDAEAKRRELAEKAQKQEEQLIHSTRLAELGEMAAAIAHEMNQPLTGINNFAKNASYMIDNNAGTLEEVRDNLRLISEQVARASKIINQMRELTRKSEQQYAALNINRILKESVDFLMPQLKLSGVETTLDFAPDLPEVIGDRIRLEQVFLNLLTNARQAMEESPRRQMTVKTYRSPDHGDIVIVEVADTGKGFTPEVRKKLFTPFFTTKKVGHGTGLGLSISLNIIKDHNGIIEAFGEQDRGATFKVHLPVGP